VSAPDASSTVCQLLEEARSLPLREQGMLEFVRYKQSMGTCGE
jgi:hypothetical protein